MVENVCKCSKKWKLFNLIFKPKLLFLFWFLAFLSRSLFFPPPLRTFIHAFHQLSSIRTGFWPFLFHFYENISLSFFIILYSNSELWHFLLHLFGSFFVLFLAKMFEIIGFVEKSRGTVGEFYDICWKNFRFFFVFWRRKNEGFVFELRLLPRIASSE